MPPETFVADSVAGPSGQVDKLLRAREARGLQFALVGRIAICCAGGILVPITSPTWADTAYTLGLVGVSLLILLYCWNLARNQRRLRFVGWTCVGIDFFTLVTLPISWYYSVGGPAVSSAFLLKNELILLCMVLIAVNGLAMRPIYPLVVAGISIALYIGLLLYSSGDPRLVFSFDIWEAFMGESVHPGLFVWRLVSLAFVGGFFAWLARTAQQTVRDAARLEHANEQMRTRHTEIVMQGRISALAGLVAGVAHEVNTPLGVVQSSMATAENCAARLASVSGAEAGGQRQRLIEVLGDSTASARQAAQRIAALVGRLRDFAGLDQAEVQETQIENALDRTLDLVHQELKGSTQVVRQYGDTPPIVCRPKELNQVFFTLITNALEAMRGGGTLRLETRVSGTHLEVQIADSGGGVREHQVPDLFEIRFASKGGRVGMGLGLPMCRNIVERHGGSIRADNREGEGLTFQILLPLEAESREPSGGDPLS